MIPLKPAAGVAQPRIANLGTRPRERRERRRARQTSRAGPSKLDDEPPRSPRARRPRHIRLALASAGYDPFERPVDRLLAGLCAHSEDAYRLEPGNDGRADAWLCRCPLHPYTGFHLTIVDRGDDQEPWLHCVVGCSRRLIESTLGLHPEDAERAKALAEQLVRYQHWLKRRSA